MEKIFIVDRKYIAIRKKTIIRKNNDYNKKKLIVKVDIKYFYQTSDYYNRNKKGKILIAFDDIIVVVLSNKNQLSEPIVRKIVTDLFIRCRKLNISIVFIRKLYFPRNNVEETLHTTLL